MDGSRQLDFKVGDWWVRPQLNELQQGDRTVRVEARSLEVLSCLARHAPGVVSKERILREVWGDAFVGEEVISHAIWELRRVFDDDARDPRYIRTVPRKGYRLVAEVEQASGGATPAIGARIGHYEIVGELGSGAMGTVYRAEDRRLRRTVALKFLAPELTRDETARQRFLREARLAASLDHPNIAPVHEIGETAEGRQFIVTACYDGGSLKDRLVRGPLTREEAVGIGLDIARGLAEAHRHGIIHRDVKPANVLLTESGTAKLVDFGVAKLLGATRLTRTGTHLGTPAYKSPEQSRGEEVDHRTDIWSLGVLLYEMLSSRRPFRGEYEHAVVHSILEEEPEPLTTGPGGEADELGRVVHKALAKEPADRHQSADELVADLERVNGRAPSTQSGAKAKTSRGLAAAAGLAAALLLAVLGWFGAPLFEGPETENPEVARLLSQAELHENVGDAAEDLASAETIYRKALELLPGNPEVQARLALLLARQQIQFSAPGRLEEIRQLVAESLETEPRLWRAWLAQAKLRLLEQEYEPAAEAAREAIELTPEGDPDSDRGHALLGEALLRLGRPEEGVRALRTAVGVGRGFIRARMVLALELWRLGELEDAAGEYGRILRDYAPNHMGATTNLALLHIQTGRYQDALPLLKKALERKRDPRLANNLGLAYFNLGRWQKALDAFHEAIRIDPEFPNSYAGLGDTYLALQQPEEAELWFEVALEKYDRVLEAGGAPDYRVGQRALCAAKLGRFEEAIAQIEEAVAESPEDGFLKFNAAQIYALAGRREELYDSVRQAVWELASLDGFRIDPAFEAYQDDPQFLAILEGAGGP